LKRLSYRAGSPRSRQARRRSFQAGGDQGAEVAFERLYAATLFGARDGHEEVDDEEVDGELSSPSRQR
jgi:hypothetical protein